MHPDDPTAQTELADFLKRQGRNQEAIEAYREVLRRDGRYARPHVDMCQIYVQLDDYPLAEGEARSALEKFRAAGNRSGEGQVLLCLGDAQRKQGGARLVDARSSVESARDLFESLGQTYAMSRVYQYLGLVAAEERNFPAATKAFEEALSRSRQLGNRAIEGLALMNLGVAHEFLGQRAQVVRYFEQSRDFYQQIGDERRLAEQEANAAAVLVQYGSNHEQALRRLANARAMLRKLGQVEFDVYAMEVEALSHVYAGRSTDARRQLLEALSFAKERQLSTRIASLTLAVAQSHFLLNEYEAARTLLDELLASDVGRGTLEAVIALGRAYVRLGDFATARKHLEQAVAGVEANGETALSPIANEALGELEYESGKPQDAREHFEKAASFWTDDLPDPASVEGRCNRGLLESLGGMAPRAQGTLEMMSASVKQARNMGRLYLEAQCRLNLARVHLAQRRFADAVAALSEIPLDGERTIGRELQALVHYWQGRVAAARGDEPGARNEAAQARKLVEQLRESLPEKYRDSFSSRAAIRPLLQ